MKNFILTTFLIIALFFNGCSCNGVYINRTEDIKEGKTFVKDFYNHIAAKDTNSINKLLSDTLKRMGGAAGISKMVKLITVKAGVYKSYEIVESATRRIAGSINETDYNYHVKVTYDKGVIDETVTLQKQKGEAIKIIGYHANSDLLLQ